MKLRYHHLLTSLSAGALCMLSATAQGKEAYTDCWAYQDYPNQTTLTDLVYTSYQLDDTSTEVIVTSGNHMDGDICGAISTKSVSEANIILNGGSNIKRIIGGHSSYNFVEGDINITINDGEADYIYGGNWYVEKNREEANNPDKYVDGYNSEETFGVQSSTGVWVPKKSLGNIRITVNGGTIEQIRGGHNCAELAPIDPSVTDDIGWYVDEDGNVTDKRPFSVGGNVYIELNGGTVGKAGADAIRGAGGSWCSVDGIVDITVKGQAEVLGNIYAGARNKYGQVGGTDVKIQGGSVTGDVYGGGSYDSTAKISAICQGDTNVSVSGGSVGGNVYGSGKQDIVQGSSNVTISGGQISKNVYGGGKGSTIAQGTNLTLAGGTVVGNIYGTGEGDTVGGDITVQVTGGDWSSNEIHALGTNATHTNGQSSLIIGSQDKSFNGGFKALSGFKNLVINKGSSLNMNAANIFSITSQTITLSTANLRQAAISGGYAAVEDGGISLTLQSEGRLGSGKYMIATANTLRSGRATGNGPTGWNEANVEVNGIATLDDLCWIGNTLYLTYEAPLTDAAAVSNWGVFKSSQAFTSTLWGNRSNAVILPPDTASQNGKSPITGVNATRNMVWGTVYSQNGRISGAGADYSLYGAAFGAERQFGSTGSSIGVAFGYDWGKVTPFTTTSIDQETWHAALYGRVRSWKAAKGIVSVDWSAAYGNSTSKHNDLAGDWSQNSWQLDLRASYSQALSKRATANIFAGLQYYTHDDASVDGIHISSLQNLRLTAGAGLSYAATARTTLYGEANVYFDAMRHNPCAVENGIRLQGTNPGRLGGVFSVGADYSISDQWLLRGGYSFDVARDSTEHILNAGVQYSF